MQLITLGEALDSAQLGAAGLHREHEAGTHCFAVHQDRAGAAYAMLAAEMSAGEIQLLSDEIRPTSAVLRPDVHRFVRWR